MLRFSRRKISPMRAARFMASGQALELTEIDTPQPVAGELLIAVRCCGICGSDLHLADMHADSGLKPLPPGTVMGHEFAGEVAEVGAGVSNFRPGDRVTAMPMMGCGTCLECLRGANYRCARVRYCGLGDIPGAYADYVRVGAGETLHLPEGVDFVRGAMVEPLAVGLHAVNAARLTPGESVLVLGAGPVGLAVAQWCQLFGAREVVVVDRVAARLALAERLGATQTVDTSREELLPALRRMGAARPAVVMECIGVPGTQQLAMDHAPVGGRVVVVGVCMAPDTLRPVRAITRELQVNYVYMYRRDEFALTIDLLDRGRLQPDAMLTGMVEFADFPAAFEGLKTDKSACKVLLLPQGVAAAGLLRS